LFLSFLLLSCLIWLPYRAAPGVAVERSMNVMNVSSSVQDHSTSTRSQLTIATRNIYTPVKRAITTLIGRRSHQ